MPHDEERIPGDRLAEEMETRPEKKGVSTSEYIYVCKKCQIKVIGCRARPCCYCESGLCSECFEKAEYQRGQNHRRVDD